MWCSFSQLTFLTSDRFEIRSIISWHSLSAGNADFHTTSSGNLAPIALKNVLIGDAEAGDPWLPNISIELRL